jgi:hypothetical protein
MRRTFIPLSGSHKKARSHANRRHNTKLRKQLQLVSSTDPPEEVRALAVESRAAIAASHLAKAPPAASPVEDPNSTRFAIRLADAARAEAHALEVLVGVRAIICDYHPRVLLEREDVTMPNRTACMDGVQASRDSGTWGTGQSSSSFAGGHPRGLGCWGSGRTPPPL